MNRRDFFKFSWGVVGVGALVSAVGVSLGAVIRFLMPSVFYEPPQAFKIGNPGDFPFGPPTFLVEEKIFVFRDRDKGFAAASAVCTHLGCTVQYEPQADRIHCACHGGVYNPYTGANVSGPPPKPLKLFKVAVNDAGVEVSRA
jgi:cytochrome b6-f complex iron-sulfur subunit